MGPYFLSIGISGSEVEGGCPKCCEVWWLGFSIFFFDILLTIMQMSLITICKGGNLSVIMNFHNLLVFHVGFVFLCFSKYLYNLKRVIFRGILQFNVFEYIRNNLIHDKYIYYIIFHAKVHNFVLKIWNMFFQWIFRG